VQRQGNLYQMAFEDAKTHQKLPTRLSDYGLVETDIEIIITQLKSHNLTQLGEHKTVSLEISRQILATSI
ncbi:hypothetical protein OPU39_06565, partial [Acinetobacter nosocomialis]|nr:hypothetical protein [Acinetobacter nosocomialis]